MSGGWVGIPILTFPSRFSPALQHEAKHCHAAKSLCCVSAHTAENQN